MFGDVFFKGLYNENLFFQTNCPLMHKTPNQLYIHIHPYYKQIPSLKISPGQIVHIILRKR